MFNNFFWESEDNENTNKDEWEMVCSMEINIPKRLMLRENIFAVENQNGEEINVDEDDKYILLHELKEVFLEVNKSKKNYRAYYFNSLGEKEYFEEGVVEDLVGEWNKIKEENSNAE